MDVQILEVSDSRAAIIQMKFKEITHFPWQKYSTDPKTGEEIYVLHFPDETKCELGSKIFQKDIYGRIIFVKAKQTKISTIDFDDIPEILEHMITGLSLEEPGKSSLEIVDDPDQEDEQEEHDHIEYFEYFARDGYDSF